MRTTLSRGTCYTFILLMGMTGRSYTTMGQPSLTTVARSNTDFSSAMYRILTKGAGDDQNLVFSPYSISAVMAMLKLGANGGTASDIRNAMRYPESDETLGKGYKELVKILQGTGDFTLKTVNKIYAKTGFKIKDTFTSQLKEYFNATIGQLDFSDGVGAAEEINRFVEKVTRDKIKDLVTPEDFNDLTRLVLLNAIYFKGTWKYKFDKDATKDEDFYIGNGQTMKVPMMNIETNLRYAEIRELNARAVALPYMGDKLYMIILLPNEKDGIHEMEDKLSKSSSTLLRKIPNKMWVRLVNLKLPRFRLDSTIDLKGPLRELGAGSIFIPGVADFSKILETKENLYVSQALQKAFIEVNEEGSEAAAATFFGIEIESESKPIPPPVTEMHIDHPFISLIAYKLDVDCNRHGYLSDPNQWGNKCEGEHEILFISKVSKPEEGSGSSYTSLATRMGNTSKGGIKSAVGFGTMRGNIMIFTIMWNSMSGFMCEHMCVPSLSPW